MLIKMAAKFLAFLVLFVFFAIVGFGLSHSSGMEMKSDGTMGGCLFTRIAEICPMTVVAHIATWQQLFVATPQKTIAVFLIITFLTAANVLAMNRNFFWKERLRRAIAHTLYLRTHPLFPLYNALRELFSGGILHPRIYPHTIF